MSIPAQYGIILNRLPRSVLGISSLRLEIRILCVLMFGFCGAVDFEGRLIDPDGDSAFVVPLGTRDPHDQTVNGKRDEPDHRDEEGDVRRVSIGDGTLHGGPHGSSTDTGTDQTYRVERAMKTDLSLVS